MSFVGIQLDAGSDSKRDGPRESGFRVEGSVCGFCVCFVLRICPQGGFRICTQVWSSLLERPYKRDPELWKHIPTEWLRGGEGLRIQSVDLCSYTQILKPYKP